MSTGRSAYVDYGEDGTVEKLRRKYEVTMAYDDRGFLASVWKPDPGGNPGFGHNTTIVPFSPADWDSSDCETENCVLATYHQIRKKGYRYGTPPGGWLVGPNSNTFTERILQGCGVTAGHWPDGITAVTRPEGD